MSKEIPFQEYERQIALRISDLTEDDLAINADKIRLEIGESPYGYHPIHLQKGTLKPPFHEKIHLMGYVHELDFDNEHTWSEIAQKIIRIIREHGDFCERLRDMTGKILAICDKHGMRLKSYTIPSIGFDQIGVPALDLVAKITMVDESLMTRDVQVAIMGRSKNAYRDLIMHGKAQEYRARRKKDGLVTTMVMQNALLHQNYDNRFEIEGEITRYLQAEMTNKDHQGELHRRLRERRLINPRTIETISVKNGEIRGRIRLEAGISINRHAITLNQVLPQSIQATAVGKKLRDVVEHPWIPDEAIVTKIITRREEATIIEFDCQKVIFPSGFLEA